MLIAEMTLHGTSLTNNTASDGGGGAYVYVFFFIFFIYFHIEWSLQVTCDKRHFNLATSDSNLTNSEVSLTFSDFTKSNSTFKASFSISLILFFKASLSFFTATYFTLKPSLSFSVSLNSFSIVANLAFHRRSYSEDLDSHRASQRLFVLSSIRFI